MRKNTNQIKIIFFIFKFYLQKNAIEIKNTVLIFISLIYLILILLNKYLYFIIKIVVRNV
jgi:hypothetical protein